MNNRSVSPHRRSLAMFCDAEAPRRNLFKEFEVRGFLLMAQVYPPIKEESLCNEASREQSKEYCHSMERKASSPARMRRVEIRDKEN